MVTGAGWGGRTDFEKSYSHCLVARKIDCTNDTHDIYLLTLLIKSAMNTSHQSPFFWCLTSFDAMPLESSFEQTFLSAYTT